MRSVSAIRGFLLVAVVGMFVPSASAAAQAPQPAPAAAQAEQPPAGAGEARQPTVRDVETALKRTLGYDPTVNWKVFSIEPSVIPGVFDVVLALNNKEPQHVFFDPALQVAIAGDILPFGPDPYAGVRKQLQAANGPSIGPGVPVITVVEFSDLECAACKTARETMKRLATDFPEVRITFQQLPLPSSTNPWAMQAALYAECSAEASPADVWKFIDGVFDNQDKMATMTADDQLMRIATAAGLDADKISTCAGSEQAQAGVRKSMALGQALKVTAIPTLFVNGRRVANVAGVPYDQLKKVVKFEIDNATR